MANPPATLAIPDHQLDREDVEPWATSALLPISVARGIFTQQPGRLVKGRDAVRPHAPGYRPRGS